MGRRKQQKGGLVLIRREEVVAGGHHGGAWKVAYADFVTAMMAFFLLMWLINATTEKQRRGIADYFSPDGVKTRSQSGSGKPFGGLTPFEQGSQVSNLGSVSLTDQVSNPDTTVDDDDDADPAGGAPGGARDAQRTAGRALFQPAASDPDAVPIEGDNRQDGNSGRGTAASSDGEAGDAPAHPTPAASVADATTTAALARASARPAPTPTREERALQWAARSVTAAIAGDAATRDMADQVSVAVTPEGLRIQIEDSEHKPMFDNGSALPNSRARALLERIGPVLAPLAEPISITGHTDAAPCLGACVSNWALSSARADATRMVLDASDVADRRIARVVGVADRDPLAGLSPEAPANRRIVLLLQRLAPAPGAPASSPRPALPAATVATSPIASVPAAAPTGAGPAPVPGL